MASSARLARSGAAAAILLADSQLGVGFATGQVAGCGTADEAIVLIPPGESVAEFPELEAAEQAAETRVAEPQTVYVYVCGAVRTPGVVEVPEGSRAAEALELAGGMTTEADPFYVNLAEIVTDGQKLYFPTASEAEELEAAGKAAEEGLVNINTASAEELCTLPGIGASRAADIVRYREKNGAFQTKEDIMKVSGIKQNAYDKLCDRITVQ
jgi:competence protein ComEA